jgi:hypothetical protein
MSQATQLDTSRIRRRALRVVASATVMLAVAAPPSGAQDLRSPDVILGGRSLEASTTESAGRDARTPDAILGGRSLDPTESRSAREPRTPDAILSGRLDEQPIASPDDESGSVEWAYIALGGFALMVGAGAVTVVHRRRNLVRPSAVIDR